MQNEDVIRLFPDDTQLSKEGSLTIGKHSLRQLARQWGTPLYVYHGGTFYNHVNRIRALLTRHYPGAFEVSYAGKAYLSMHFARILNRTGVTLDTVSLGEMIIARKAGYPPGRVHLHGNNKSEQELRYALDWGIDNIVIDSLEELDFLEQIAGQLGKVANIWMRITPGVDVDTHPYVQTAHHASKFGFPIEDGQAAQGIQKAKSSPHLRLKGLHMHIGSQVFDTAPYLKALKSIIELAEREHLPLEQISPGGGWGVPYLLSQQEIDLETLIAAISELLVNECARLGWSLPKLVVEPGRRLVADACVALYTIGTVKSSSDGTCFASIDGGMADNPRPALYDSPYTALVLDKPSTGASKCYTVVGKFCESGDKIIKDILLPELERGDLLAIPVSGAYQLSMSSNYNLAGRPAVLWLEEDHVEVMQPRERVEEMQWWVGNEPS